MPFKPVPARINLLPAKNSPRVVIVRRKPSKTVHIMLWDTATDEIEHGSWFTGNFDLWGCDLSFDGSYLVYGAQSKGARHHGEAWSGVCRPPWLKTMVDVYSQSGYSAGYWSDPGVLRAHDPRWFKPRAKKDLFSIFETLFPSAFGIRHETVNPLPFEVRGFRDVTSVPPLPAKFVLRLERDGWRRNGSMPSELRKWRVKQPVKGDPGWSWRFSPKHPELIMRFEGNVDNRGYVFDFSMPENPALIDPEVQWATWTCEGDLILARGGAIERYTLPALRSGKPTFRLDLEPLARPVQS